MKKKIIIITTLFFVILVGYVIYDWHWKAVLPDEYRFFKAFISSVEIKNIEDDKLMVYIEGEFSNTCPRIHEISHERFDNNISIKVIADQIAGGTACGEAITPFGLEVEIDISELEFESYLIDVNNYQKEFNLKPPDYEVDLEDIQEIQQKTTQKYSDLLKEFNENKARQEIILWLQEQEKVESAGISIDNTTIWVKFTNEVELNIITF